MADYILTDVIAYEGIDRLSDKLKFGRYNQRPSRGENKEGRDQEDREED